MTFDNELKPSLEEALEHYGVLGMKWGVRRSRDELSRIRKEGLTDKQKRGVKKTAVVTGSLLMIAGGAYAAHALVTGGSASVAAVSKTVAAKAGAAAVNKVLQEPTDIIYATRGKNKGFRFLEDGGIDPLNEWSKGFDNDSVPGGDFFKEYEGKIAAQFMDPKGRTDRAGRLIPHTVILPPGKTEGINNIEDVKEKVWPTLEAAYDEFWEESLEETA